MKLLNRKKVKTLIAEEFAAAEWDAKCIPDVDSAWNLNDGNHWEPVHRTKAALRDQCRGWIGNRRQLMPKLAAAVTLGRRGGRAGTGKAKLRGNRAYYQRIRAVGARKRALAAQAIVGGDKQKQGQD